MQVLRRLKLEQNQEQEEGRGKWKGKGGKGVSGREKSVTGVFISPQSTPHLHLPV